jgi:hypothetical protein
MEWDATPCEADTTVNHPFPSFSNQTNNIPFSTGFSDLLFNTPQQARREDPTIGVARTSKRWQGEQ